MNQTRIVRMCKCALMTAALSVAAVISFPLPFTQIPLSLATFAVLLAGALLGPLDGVVSVALYLLLGIAGIPVFAGMQSGFAVLTGPTGGFLAGYLFMALISGLAPRPGSKSRGRFLFRIPVRILMFSLATLALYLFGCLWYTIYAGVPFGAAVAACALPFLPGDAVKIAAASVVAARFAKTLRTAAA